MLKYHKRNDFNERSTFYLSRREPQCYEWVLHEATQLDWSEDAAKALVVIGDDVPHPPCVTDQSVSWKTEAQLLKAQGVKVSERKLKCVNFFCHRVRRTTTYVRCSNHRHINTVNAAAKRAVRLCSCLTNLI